jgi:hypothetical protein
MNAGFICVGSHGTVQIDQDWINMVFVQKGTLNFNGNTSPGIGGLSVVYTGEAPIIFVQTGTLFVYPMQATRSGNVWTWSFIAVGPSGESAETATYYIFDKQPNVETHCGLNVYDGNRRVTFNSDYRPMRIAAIIAVPYSYGNPGVNQAVTGGSGVYAATLPSPGFSSRKLTASVGFQDYQGYRLSGGTTFQTGVTSTSGPPLNGGMGGGMGIVIDVGGL